MTHDLHHVTKAGPLQYRFFTDAVKQLDDDLRPNLWAQEIVHHEWHKILKDEPGRKRRAGAGARPRSSSR